MTTGSTIASPLTSGQLTDKLWIRVKSEVAYRRIVSAWDSRRFNEIRERYRAEENTTGGKRHAPYKYLDYAEFLRSRLRLAMRLGLDYAPKLNVLDLGSGAGYFLVACRYFGHSVLGLDIDGVPLYDDLVRFFDLPRITHAIQANEPLPALPSKMDLINAHAIVFNNREGVFWSAAEWKYFVGDIHSRLNPGGRLFLGISTDDALANGVRDFLASAPGFTTHVLANRQFILTASTQG